MKKKIYSIVCYPKHEVHEMFHYVKVFMKELQGVQTL